MRWNCAGAFASPNGMTKNFKLSVLRDERSLGLVSFLDAKKVVSTAQVQCSEDLASGQDLAMKGSLPGFKSIEQSNLDVAEEFRPGSSENNEEKLGQDIRRNTDIRNWRYLDKGIHIRLHRLQAEIESERLQEIGLRSTGVEMESGTRGESNVFLGIRGFP
ncbi:hypothetical protein BASA81_014312 [Batrachochytrium salamandrivorans]|nr:hypothetical protein BASA81_014312 [Batrachochytrium salamandrivorans]